MSSGTAGGMVSSELRLMLNRSYVQNDVGDQVQLLLLSQQIIQLEDQKVSLILTVSILSAVSDLFMELIIIIIKSIEY